MSEKSERNLYWKAQFLVVLNYTQILLRKGALLCLAATSVTWLKNELMKEIVNSELMLDGGRIDENMLEEAFLVLVINLSALWVLVGGSIIIVSWNLRNSSVIKSVKQIAIPVFFLFLILIDFEVALSVIVLALVASLVLKVVHTIIRKIMWEKLLKPVVKATSFWDLPGSESIDKDEYYQVLKNLIPVDSTIFIESLILCMEEVDSHILFSREKPEGRMVRESLTVVYRIGNSMERYDKILYFNDVIALEKVR